MPIEAETTSTTAHPPLEVLSTELPEGVWQRIAAVLPPNHSRPYTYERRAVVQAILYVIHTGCGWRELPERFPSYRIVHHQFKRWQHNGLWDQIWTILCEPMSVWEDDNQQELAEGGGLKEAQRKQPVMLPDELWRQIAAVLPVRGGAGRPATYDRRAIVEAIVYRLRTKCSWRKFPVTFPPRKTVADQLARWQQQGIWEKIWAIVTGPVSLDQLQL